MWGRTLIELLVSIALGLLILLGVGTLYLGANQSARVASNVGSIQESAATVIALIGPAIRRAGYTEIVGVGGRPSDTFLYNGPHLLGCTNGRFADAANDNFACVNGLPADGDTVAVWFQADNRVAAAQGPTLDCLGNGPLAEWTITGQFAGLVPGGTIPLVRNVYFLDNAGNLMCLGNGNATPQPLMNGVEQLKVYYAFDDVAFGPPISVLPDQPTARSIRDAAFINSQPAPPGGEVDAWDYVISVHVCVVLRSQEAGLRVTAGNDFRPCPVDATEAAGNTALVAGPADGALRRSFTQVFTIRSRSQPSPLG